MMENRSAPPGPIVPRLIYDDVAEAINWLFGAFGFTERLRTPAEADGTIHHAQMTVGTGSVILTGQRGVTRPEAPEQGAFVPSLLVRVANVEAHFARAKRFGARILSPLATHPFGERQYSAEDLGGYRWTFSQSVTDVPPEEWGAKVAERP